MEQTNNNIFENIDVSSGYTDLYDDEIMKEARVIYIGEDITESLTSRIIKQILIYNIEDLKINIEDRIPIKLLINTCGGLVTESLTIYDMLQTSKTPVIGVNVGKCYSGGAILFLGCNKRYCLENSSFMIHQGFIDELSGNYNEIKNFIDFYSSLQLKLSKIISERTKIPFEVYQKNIEKDWYLSQEEIIKYGISDQILKSFMEII
jgi:ATP-dependent Clp protease, protease subunit